MLQIIASNKVAFSLLSAVLLGTIVFSIAAIGDSTAGISLWLNLAALPLAMALSISIYTRGRTEWRRVARRKQARHFGEPFVLSLALPVTETSNLVKTTLGYFNWRLQDLHPRELLALEKGRAGIWGSILFHIGLLTLVLGLLAGQLWGFRGILPLTIGESFVEGVDEYQSLETGWLIAEESAQDFRITLTDFDPNMKTPRGITEVSRVRIEQNGEIFDGEVSFNHGLSIKDRIVHQGNWGYSPGILLKDNQDQILFNGYIRITSAGGHDVASYADYIAVGEDLQLDLRFYPDAVRKADSTVRETVQLINPLLEIELHRGEELLISTALSPGDGRFVDGYFVAFPRLRYWSQLSVVSDPTLKLLYIGCTALLLGLSLRTIFIRKQLVVSIVPQGSGSSMKISGWTEKYKTTYREELQQILKAVRDQAAQLEVNSAVTHQDQERI